MASKATRESFGETILELAATNENLVVLDADLSKSTMTQPFMKKYPARHFEMGIAEQNMIGVAAGPGALRQDPRADKLRLFSLIESEIKMKQFNFTIEKLRSSIKSCKQFNKKVELNNKLRTTLKEKEKEESLYSDL